MLTLLYALNVDANIDTIFKRIFVWFYEQIKNLPETSLFYWCLVFDGFLCFMVVTLNLIRLNIRDKINDDDKYMKCHPGIYQTYTYLPRIMHVIIMFAVIVSILICIGLIMYIILSIVH